MHWTAALLGQFELLHIVGYTLVALLALFVLSYLQLSRRLSHTGGVPRVGPPGVLGYIKTAIKYTLDAEPVIIQGRKDFAGQPFILPTLSGPIFLLPPKYLDVVRSGNDDTFNQPGAVNEDLQLPYTMDVHQLDNPYQATVLRTSVNRALPSLIPSLRDETIQAMNETFSASDGPVSLPVFDTMTHLIARVSNRVILGTDLCRNKHFLHAVVRFAETTPMMAPFIQWSPFVARGFVYFVLSSILGGKREPLAFVVPFLKERREKVKLEEEDEPLIADFLLRAAPADEPLKGIAMRLMNINFGSIHTSSIFTTQVLFELALLSKQELDDIREEVLAALESEGGWNKLAVLKFRKIDSCLREIGRYYGLMHFGLGRVSVLGHDLGNGTRVPAGCRVAIDMKAVHYNPEVYSDPYKCDLFRFSKIREDGDAGAKFGFTTLDKDYLPFGAGRHACAGRFFAATELKMMLAHILLEYDISFPPGVTTRPPNLIFNGAIVPDPTAKLLFTRRT